MQRTEEISCLIRGVDLFCGVGGLTCGLEASGIDIALGIDLDPACEYPYTANNDASFLLQSVENVTSKEIREAFGDARYRLLAGCAPCQPFSTYTQGKSNPTDSQWNLLEHFSRLVRATAPHLVTMENVPRLAREDVFKNFVSALEDEEFDVFYDVVPCADFGVPQRRRRLVLLASRLGPIQLVAPTIGKEGHATVRRAIGDMPALEAGQSCPADPLHRASELSPINLERIRASNPGGTWRDWDETLRAKCHQEATGKTYASVYGRMSWDDLAPTVTTQYYGFGNGRFGHPDQDRAISVREGAVLQSFPKTYKFVREGEPIHNKTIGRLVGNAVPVELSKAIGMSLAAHVQDSLVSRGLAGSKSTQSATMIAEPVNECRLKS